MPKKNKIEFFIVGVIAAFSALFLENVFNIVFSLNQKNISAHLTLALIAYVVIEESLKIIILRQKINTCKNNLLHREVFSWAFFLGFGFAATEIFHRYLLNSTLPANDILPIFGLLSVHIASATIIGYLLHKSKSLYLIFILSSSLHLFYNYLIFQKADPLLIIFYIFLLFMTSIFVFLDTREY